MDLQTIIESNQGHANDMAIAGLNYCDKLRGTYKLANLELSYLLSSDTAIACLIKFCHCFKAFHDQCMIYPQNPTEENRLILQKCFTDLDEAYQSFKNFGL